MRIQSAPALACSQCGLGCVLVLLDVRTVLYLLILYCTHVQMFVHEHVQVQAHTVISARFLTKFCGIAAWLGAAVLRLSSTIPLKSRMHVNPALYVIASLPVKKPLPCTTKVNPLRSICSPSLSGFGQYCRCFSRQVC